MTSQNQTLATSTIASQGTFARATKVAARALKRLLLWPVHVARARRDFAQLAAMNDHELKDIGLARHDIANATALAGDEDATLMLAQAARRQRGHSSRLR